MTEEEQNVLLIKGLIASLPPAEQEATLEFAEHLRQMVMRAGIPVGPMALSLVGAELSAKAESND